MKAYLSAFLLLLTVVNAQVILSEDFNNGFPQTWQKRFGLVADGTLSFANRSTTTDVFTPALDLSGDGTFILTFDMRTNAATSHSLLIGLSPVGEGVTWIAGSAFAALSKPLGSVLTGSPSWASQTIDLTPTLSAFSPAERYGVRIAISTWLSGSVSSEPVFLDNLIVSDPPASAIAEPSCISCLAGLVALLLAGLKRKTL